jgi:FKBP-type peptidyl-prolyl cis-trans isomerase FkpA
MARTPLVAAPLVLFLSLLGVSPDALAGDEAAVAPASAKRAFVRVPAPDGIQIRRYNKTDGASPGKKDRVVVHYHGTLEDGTVFDSSVKRGQPSAFPIKNVIPCWQESLTRLHVGEEARLTCPPDTAYGAKGSPPNVPPNETLTFEVELLGIHSRPVCCCCAPGRLRDRHRSSDRVG